MASGGTSYFSRNASNLILQKRAEDGPGLRDAQLGAFWAVCSHFTVSADPAIVTMPTGSGKTAVLILLPYGLKAHRVLVVTPSVLVRDQAAQEFSKLSLLASIGAVPKDMERPKVGRITRQLRSPARWANLSKFDVAIATINCVSPGYRPIRKALRGVPQDLFDLLLIDEAHHVPARTWRAVLEAFPTAQKILFTATPFRRDKREIPGQIVYSYPLSRAVEEGIYCPIKLVPVDPITPANRDLLLAEKAKQVLATEQKANRPSKLLIRIDRISDAERLRNTYAKANLRVGVVHSAKSLRHNLGSIKRLQEDELDGLICVGMLGEGFDLPKLKIAVYHQPHQSFPATLQFVGRIARVQANKFPKAFLVAPLRDVGGETRKLYEEDSDWGYLLPHLAEAAVEEERKVRKRLEEFKARGDSHVSLRTLAPYFSARICWVSRQEVDFERVPKLQKSVLIKHRWFHADLNCAVIITERPERVPWSKAAELTTTFYDLHIFYHDEPSGMLFAASSHEATGDLLLDEFIRADYYSLKAEEINRVLYGAGSVDYFQIGLRNIASVGPGAPAYKTLAGLSVQAAVGPSDARVFTTGHLFGRISSKKHSELRGLSISSSKVWSAQRGSIISFVEWCQTLARQIVTAGNPVVPPHLSSLAVPQRVLFIPSRPLAVAWDLVCFRGIVDVMVQQGKEPKKLCSMLDTTVIAEDLPNNPAQLRIVVQHEEGGLKLGARFSCIGAHTFQEDGLRVGKEVVVQVDDGRNRVEQLTIEDFFQKFPPTIYLVDGTSFVGQDLYKASGDFPALPAGTLMAEDWSGVEIDNETRPASPTRLNVQDFTFDYVRRNMHSNTFIIKDHGSGEIADYIAIVPKERQVHLFHCKASLAPQPGARVDDLYEVAGQAIKSLQWCRQQRLFEEIIRRVERKPVKLVQGNVASVRTFLSSAPASTFTYTIYLVQPGLRVSVARAGSQINSLLASCYAWIQGGGGGISLKVMGA